MTNHTLYRFFDSDDALLYVGRTINPGRRWREHEKRQLWFDSVATVTREVLPSAELLADAERAAIVNEHPLHNIVLNRGRIGEEVASARIDRLLYSLSETAERLELNDAQLDVLIRLGEIETVYIGRRRLVPNDALTEYVERLKAAS